MANVCTTTYKCFGERKEIDSLFRNLEAMLSYNDIQITFSSDFRGYCNSDVYIKIDGHLPWRALPFGWTQQFEDTAIYDIVHHDDFIADWKESNEAYDAYIQSLK